ncbi:hypothetical protein DXG03_003769 [Asterophora parasitica]|uniref:Uncharacterized protein n=1 Tax=Asterophora parasitica TaxID=117018 RepID=A0A9P7G7C2_9AGAR|nr:hypothetical protein DXG03_003769 [Asterophora parasitica]
MHATSVVAFAIVALGAASTLAVPMAPMGEGLEASSIYRRATGIAPAKDASNSGVQHGTESSTKPTRTIRKKLKGSRTGTAPTITVKVVQACKKGSKSSKHGQSSQHRSSGEKLRSNAQANGSHDTVPGHANGTANQKSKFRAADDQHGSDSDSTANVKGKIPARIVPRAAGAAPTKDSAAVGAAAAAAPTDAPAAIPKDRTQRPKDGTQHRNGGQHASGHKSSSGGLSQHKAAFYKADVGDVFASTTEVGKDHKTTVRHFVKGTNTNCAPEPTSISKGSRKSGKKLKDGKGHSGSVDGTAQRKATDITDATRTSESSRKPVADGSTNTAGRKQAPLPAGNSNGGALTPSARQPKVNPELVARAADILE